MRPVLHLLFPTLLTCAVAIPAAAQDRPAQPPQPGKPGKDDIVVVGQQKRDKPPRSALPEGGLRKGRAANADAQRFVRCMRGVQPDLLRPVVEGHAKEPKAQDALDRLIRSHPGCYTSYGSSLVPSQPAGYFGKCNPIIINAMFKMCRSFYDRGALIEEAFAVYAPHFLLRRADTLNWDVINRFRDREKLRGRYRGPADRFYYTAVACMVQVEPELAVRLIRAEAGSEREAAIRTEIFAKTKLCVNYAKRVTVDPFQFRGYVADALYHWTAAAKNVETLIASPAGR